MKSKLLAIFLSVFVFSFFNIANADNHLHKVSGVVSGCSSKHAVHVLMYEESGFKEMNHSQENIYNLVKGNDCIVNFNMEVPKGQYALASFEDKNGNGKLDFFFFIPKEPAGFYQFNGMGAPKFDKMKIDINGDIDNIEIVLP
jgi:uncharacterized protein (DUF2141 family)